jgi:hypothetical protein
MTIKKYYVLAFMLLMGYYLGDALGITTFAFRQPLYFLLPLLTLYYGSYLFLVDKLFSIVFKQLKWKW